MQESTKLSLYYLIGYSAIASWVAFFNIHLERLGFTGLQIGSFNSMYIMVSAFVVPFWGMIADQKGSYRTLLLLTGLCAMLVLLLSKTESYSSILVVIIVIALFQQPIGTLVDGMVISLSRVNRKITYGRIRLWGSFGYGLTSIIVGYYARKNTNIIFYTASILFMILFFFNLLSLPPKPLTGRGLVTYKSLGIFFRNSRIVIFLFLMFLYGISIASLYNFINLYYTEIGATNTLVGIAFFIQAGCEIPFFIFGAKMVKRTSAGFVILLAMVVSMGRMILYGFISNPSIAIFIGMFHGFTISFFLVGAVEYVQSHTPPHLRTTGQSLIWAFHFGAGLTIGYIFIGYLHDVLGMRHAMHISAAFSAVVILITYPFFHRQNAIKIKSRKTLTHAEIS